VILRARHHLGVVNLLGAAAGVGVHRGSWRRRGSAGGYSARRRLWAGGVWRADGSLTRVNIPDLEVVEARGDGVLVGVGPGDGELDEHVGRGGDDYKVGDW
jgi:hypothetical protein